VRSSFREAPAKCGECGQLWHVLASTSNGIAGVGIVIASLAAAAALVLQSYSVLVAGAALVIAHNLWAWRRVELFPISAEAASNAAKVGWSVIGIATLVRILSS
jgi:hypothetical protein